MVAALDSVKAPDSIAIHILVAVIEVLDVFWKIEPNYRVADLVNYLYLVCQKG